MIIGFCQKLNARFLPFVVRLLKCKQVQKLFLRNLSLLSSQVEGSSEHISHQSPYLPINTKFQGKSINKLHRYLFVCNSEK